MKKKYLLLSVFCYLFFVFSTQAQNTIYVNIAATGANDGSSWANAFTDFQAGVNAASSGDNLFVARGTYQPASGQSFSMKEGVKIYGGFAGTENNLSQRNLAAGNTSILKGNGNSVIYNYNNGLTAAALLDGFTITGGNNSGMINFQSSPTITNCTFSGNTASSGGGMNNTSSSPIITNCTFSGNTVTDIGGGMNNSQSSPTIIDCIFSENSAGDRGGGMSNLLSSSPNITNCAFSGNTAGSRFSPSSSGGGIYNYYSSSPAITNCTFSKNTADSYGAMFNIVSSLPSITNSIFWGNISNDGETDISGPLTINYSYTQTTQTGTGNITGSSDPFVNSSNPAGADGIFGTADDGLELAVGSAAMNAGDPQTNTTSYAVQAGNTDITGFTRIFNSRVDMGAYENQATNTITTSPLSATGYCLGTSLQVAYTISGTYNSGNIFTAQLSDASGGFNAPTNIGSVTAITSGNINATIPSNTTAGNGYRIRVVSSDPAITGSDNGANVSVNALPAVSVTSSNPHLYFGAPGDQTSTITATATGGTAPYTVTFIMNRGLVSDYINDAGNEVWTATGSTVTSPNPPSTFTGIQDGGSASINVALLADADITATVTDANGCSQTSATAHVVAEDARCFAGKSSIVKVSMCHVTNSAKNPRVQICVDQNAVQAHLDQGDFLGSCTVNARDMNLNASSVSDPAQKEEVLGKLSVEVMPNPASYHFTLVLKSLSNGNVKLTVTDISGRVIEMKTNVSANSTIQLGDNYHPGVYIAKLLQGKDVVTLRLIKGGN